MTKKPRATKIPKIDIPNIERVGMKEIKPKSINQKKYLDLMKEKKIIFALNGSGVGKTALAVMYGAQELLRGNYDKLTIIRAAVEACGESLGFLPGDSTAKLFPYMQPIFAELASYGIVNGEVQKLIQEGKLQILPIAFCRGINMHNTFCIVDEVQNVSYQQMMLILSRFGRKSKMILEGDCNQSDLPIEKRFDIVKFAKFLAELPDIGLVEFDMEKDCIREIIISDIFRKLKEYQVL
jgi:phosphate starvation-inducible PhoH-like protein